VRARVHSHQVAVDEHRDFARGVDLEKLRPADAAAGIAPQQGHCAPLSIAITFDTLVSASSDVVEQALMAPIRRQGSPGLSDMGPINVLPGK
jgi:hypothetical protein